MFHILNKYWNMCLYKTFDKEIFLWYHWCYEKIILVTIIISIYIHSINVQTILSSSQLYVLNILWIYLQIFWMVQIIIYFSRQKDLGIIYFYCVSCWKYKPEQMNICYSVFFIKSLINVSLTENIIETKSKSPVDCFARLSFFIYFHQFIP